MAKKIKLNEFQQTEMKNTLYNCSKDVIRDQDKYISYGKGILVGCIGSIMAVNNLDFSAAVELIKPYLPKDLELKCIPESWTAEFMTNEAKAELKESV